MNTICIMCPMGCQINVEEIDGAVLVEGNACPRGRKYGEQEFVAPMRTLTTLVKTIDGAVASVKTKNQIPKDKMFDLVRHVASLTVPADCKIGDLVESNPLGLQTDIVITGRP